jgi:hypothetical protein
MRIVVVASFTVALLAVPGAARADVGVTLDRTSGRPGELVQATSSALTLSLYLAPAATVPRPRSCQDGRAICAPTSLGPPRRAGWTWLGRFFPTRPSFRFRVPRAEPGLYRAVVYCAPCTRGPRGSLIAGRQLFRIR